MPTANASNGFTNGYATDCTDGSLVGSATDCANNSSANGSVNSYANGYNSRLAFSTVGSSIVHDATPGGPSWPTAMPISTDMPPHTR